MGELMVELCFFLARLQNDSSLNMDWDDVEGNTKRRLEGLRLEKIRLEESRRLKMAAKQEEKEGNQTVDRRRKPAAKH
jgi:hypothetical protein